MQMGETFDGSVNGRDESIAMLKKELEGSITVHQIHHGEFFFDEDKTVKVLWPMQDIVDSKAYVLQGAGFYKETYIFEDEQWRIRHWRLLRTRVNFKPKSFMLRIVLFLHAIGILGKVAPDVSLKISRMLSSGVDVEEFR